MSLEPMICELCTTHILTELVLSCHQCPQSRFLMSTPNTTAVYIADIETRASTYGVNKSS